MSSSSSDCSGQTQRQHNEVQKKSCCCCKEITEMIHHLTMVFLLSTALGGHSWTVLLDVDWPHNEPGGNTGRVVVHSASACGDACQKDPCCSAVS
jgi:hypothetical protein